MFQCIKNAIQSTNSPTCKYEPYTEVYPNLFLGGAITALNITKLVQLGINLVINVSQEKYPFSLHSLSHVNTTKEYYEKANINFIGIAADDCPSFNLTKYFIPVSEIIDKALKNNERVFIHCFAGISRSATIVIAFLVLKKNMSVSQAIHYIRKKRPINPNEGFINQLCILENNINLK